MKKQNSDPIYDLSQSLLEIPEHESKTELLEAIVNGTVSKKTLALIKCWEDVLEGHTKNWGIAQWKAISIETLWEAISNRISPPQVMQVYRKDPYGNIQHFILHQDQFFEHNEDNWDQVFYAQDLYEHGINVRDVPHRRDVLPIMIKALMNVTITHSQGSNMVPFVSVAHNITQEYQHRFTGALIAQNAYDILKATHSKNIGSVLETFSDKLPPTLMQRLWIKNGVSNAQKSWISKGIGIDQSKGVCVFYEALKETSIKQDSLKHVHTIGDILFTGKHLAQINSSTQSAFQSAVKKFVSISPAPSLEQFKKWFTTATPSPRAAQTILGALNVSNPLAKNYCQILVGASDPSLRNRLIEDLVVADSPFLNMLSNEDLHCYANKCIQNGDLAMVEKLMENVHLELTEKEWNSYWDWFTSAHMHLGGELRALMERKMLSAAIEQPSDVPVQKRKM